MASNNSHHRRQVKIVATIGPASEAPEQIEAMMDAGVDVFRMNFSHGDHEGHRRQFTAIREAASNRARHVAVMADLSGPKIRTGKMKNGGVHLSKGASLVITPEPIVGDADRIATTYGGLVRDVSPGTSILLDDGRLKLIVKETVGDDIHCEVAVGGVLSDHKGMNIPGAPLAVAALTDKDKADLAFARALGVDLFALSFVRRAADITEAKSLAGNIPVIAKIEKPEAIENLSEIIAVSDGVMVARGDLGVEAGPEQVPMLQKRIAKAAIENGIPVIVATQMMESMIENPGPTRAEVSDVANAVLDEVDAVMLSGETAVGRYPVETVRQMAAVLDAVTSSALWRQRSGKLALQSQHFSSAIARAALAIAADFDLATIVVFTESGRSAALLSTNRPDAPIVALSRHPAVLRRTALLWGVAPALTEWHKSLDAMVLAAERHLVENGLAASGDTVAVAFGRIVPGEPFRTDTLKLLKLP